MSEIMDVYERRRKWLKAFADAGHEPVLTEDGRIDMFAYEVGYMHNGPRCRKCGQGACWHCVNPSQVAEHFGKCNGGATP